MQQIVLKYLKQKLKNQFNTVLFFVKAEYCKMR